MLIQDILLAYSFTSVRSKSLSLTPLIITLFYFFIALHHYMICYMFAFDTMFIPFMKIIYCHQTMSSKTNCSSLMYPQNIKKYLAHHRYLMSIYSKNGNKHEMG